MRYATKALRWLNDVLPLAIVYGICVGIIGLAWAGKL